MIHSHYVKVQFSGVSYGDGGSLLYMLMDVEQVCSVSDLKKKTPKEILAWFKKNELIHRSNKLSRRKQ